jgi:hypothetical protein
MWADIAAQNRQTGEVGVEAARGGGACFWFEAPFPPLPASAPAHDLGGRTVAIVSRNAILREATRRQVRASGGKAVTAETVEAALDRTAPGDLLLIDAALPPRGEVMRAPAERGAVVLLAPDERDLAAQRDCGTPEPFSDRSASPK